MKNHPRLEYIKAAAGILHGSRAFGPPLRANVSLTNRCNIRCIHCFYHSPQLREKNMFDLRWHDSGDAGMPDGKAPHPSRHADADSSHTMGLLRELIDMGTRNFLFTGGGEPFLHQDSLDFMTYVKRCGGNCKVNTNGTLLSPETVDTLVDIGMDELKITTLAGTSEMYVKTHPGSGGDVFEKIEMSLDRLGRIKRSLGVVAPVVNIVFIVVSQNVDGMHDFVEFAGRVKADKVSFRPVDSINDPGLAGIVPDTRQTSEVRCRIKDLNRMLHSFGITHNLDFFRQSFDKQLDTSDLYRQIPCYYGWIQPRVEVDGNVHPCCRCFESMGNVNENSFHDIWHGELYRRFRKSAIQINRRHTSVSGCFCGTCPHYTANLRVFGAFHPIKRRSMDLKHLPMGEDE